MKCNNNNNNNNNNEGVIDTLEVLFNFDNILCSAAVK